MKSAAVYLNFPGNTEEAFTFYKSIFGGEFAGLMRFSDSPDSAETQNLSPEDKNKIMHVAYQLSPNLTLMATDSLASMNQQVTFGNNAYISVSTESKEEADKIFSALKEGGEVEMDLQDTFWNAYFGSLTDKFGVRWMVNYDY